jgi:hypothetical protein
MAENLQNGLPHPATPRVSHLVGAVQVAHDTPVRQSANGVRFATYGETGVADLDLDRMLETVPTGITARLKANTYYFVPLALREVDAALDAPAGAKPAVQEPAMVASAYTEEFSDAAICHRNVELGQGNRAVFISTRLLGDRFALSFEFFINVAHAFADEVEVPASFSELVWQQAVSGVRGETSIDAWEARNLAFGRPVTGEPEPQQPASRRNRWAITRSSARQRAFTSAGANAGAAAALSVAIDAAASQPAAEVQPIVDAKERAIYLESAFSDAVAIYLLSLALDFDYSELREREYPLLAPGALAARLKVIAELFPPNPGYEFAVRYRRRA